MTYCTPYPELNVVLYELVAGVQQVLLHNFVGAYLQGSFAIGGFDQHSDVDFIIAIDHDLSNPQLDDLQIMHKRIFNLDSEWAKHLEGSYFPTAVLRNHARNGSELWYLEHGMSVLERSNHCNTVVVRWILREKGTVLSGPEPSTLIESIPVAVLRRDMLTAINYWGNQILTNPGSYQNRFYQSYIVLNYCRMLHDLHTGEAGSKRSGAEWAKTNLHQSWAGLIDRAWDRRPNPAVSVKQPADEADFRSTLELVREVMKESNDFAAAADLRMERID